MKISTYEKTAINILELLKDNQRDFYVEEILQRLSINSYKFYVAVTYLLPSGYIVKDNSKRPAIYKYNIERNKI
jgi:DNA-binding IclR family transcriptional regulator